MTGLSLIYRNSQNCFKGPSHKFRYTFDCDIKILFTLGVLKLGLVCLTNFGESSNFLDMACLAKTRNSQFSRYIF